MKRRRLESIYVISVEFAYIEKTKNNDSIDFWHMRLGHMSYPR